MKNRARLFRPFVSALAGMSWAVWLTLGVGDTAALAATPGVQVVRSDASGVLVEITTPEPQILPLESHETSWSVGDWTCTTEPGAPELPVTGFDLAVPPGTHPVLSARVLESLPRPGDPPRAAPDRVIELNEDGMPAEQEARHADPGKYAQTFPAAWATLGPVGNLRFLRVVPVTVYPYRWDPSLRAVVVASRLQIEVRFEANAALGARSLLEGRALERDPGSDHPGWDELYNREVLNGDPARAWRRAPALRRGIGGAKLLTPGVELRIPITRSDLYRVPYASLVAAGWPAEAVPVSRVALVERFFDERFLASPDSVDLAFREQPVPIQVRDRDGDGQFGPGDDFLFFGLSAWDRLHPLPRDKRYGREHDYFVSSRDEGGARFAEEPSFLDATGLVPVSSSVVTRHYEGDGVYLFSYAAGDDGGVISLGVEGINNEHMYWTGGAGGDYPVSFDLPGILAGPGNVLRLRIPVQRLEHLSTSGEADATFSARAQGGGWFDLPDTLRVPGKSRQVYDPDASALEPLALGPSGNVLRMRMEPGKGDAALDWMEWTWRRDLNAADHRLFFNTGDLAGRQEFSLLGFGPADTTAASRLLLLDLADSARTSTTPGPRLMTWTPSQYVGGVLRIQLDLGGPPRARTIYAVSPDVAVVPAFIVPVSPVDLKVPDGADEDLLIIAHPDFLDPGIVPGIDALAQARRAQGLSVRVVTTRQVYDQFNGGRSSPVAIRNYLRYLFHARTTPPSFLLLAGDASDDFTGGNPRAGENLVPTQTVFSDARSDQGGELVSSDEWFVDNLSPAGSAGLGERIDFRPDMHVGRISAGNPTEMAAALDKILAYTDYTDASASWRSRALLISDDEFSNSIGFEGEYHYQGDTSHPVRRDGESLFRWASRETRRIIREDAGFADFGVDTFFIATYMDTVPTLQRCREADPGETCPYYPCSYGTPSPTWCMNTHSVPYQDNIIGNWRDDNYDYGKTILPPILRQYMNKGHLLTIYQGHSNGHVMSHEYIYQDALNLREDTAELANGGRPFFFMGFGCHLAEFSSFSEGEGYSARGGCISERMLLADHRRGSVASYASTAYEWLSNSAIPNLAIIRSMFIDPPRDPTSGRTRWLLGEIVTASKWRMGSGQYTAPYMAATYTLLGDPSMPLEMGPPSLAVYVNCDPGTVPTCEPWVDGTDLEAEATSDTVRIRVRLRDEQGLVGGVTLRDASGIIDTTAYHLTTDPAYPGDDRRLVLAYNRRLSPPAQDYDIELDVTDSAGQLRRAVLPVRLATDFYTVREGARALIQENDVLEAGDSVIVHYVSPVGVNGEETDFWLDDAPLPLAARLPRIGPRQGELRAVLPALSEGSHRLRFRTAGTSGAIVERETTFQGPGAEQTSLVLLYNFPNPFDKETAFYYRLNRSGVSAKVSIFTLSGRKIWSVEGPARANDNAIVWDGRDADGDAVANGLYLYKIEIRTAEGSTISRVERVARIR